MSIAVENKDVIANSDGWREKIHPRNVQLSPLMVALVGYVLDAVFSEPTIAELVITCDGHVLASHSDNLLADHYIGTEEQLFRNWKNLLVHVGATEDEQYNSLNTLRSKIRY